MDTVSVIIPTYNREKTIIKSIESALSQTYPPLEILVCDDGSTDSTQKLISQIKDPRVIWIDGKHSGLPAVPRNRGIKKAKGKWVAFLDSDDEWLENKLEMQLKISKISGCKAVCSNALHLYRDEKINGLYIPWSKKNITFNDLLTGNLVVCSSAIIQKSLIEGIGYFPTDQNLLVGEDYAVWMRIVTKSDFAYINIPLLKYKDDIKHSVRGQSKLNELRENQNVMKNFIVWGIENKVSYRYIVKAIGSCIKYEVRLMKKYFKKQLKIENFNS